jgi:hypothetical protein
MTWDIKADSWDQFPVAFKRQTRDLRGQITENIKILVMSSGV